MKLKQISIVTLKEKTLELEHNQDKYIFIFIFYFSIFKYLKFISVLSMFFLYMHFLFFNASFPLRDYIGNEAMQLFCAITVAIDALIFFRNSLTIL